MKALLYTGAYQLELREMEKPAPREDEVCIRVKAVAICGSDLSGYRGENSLRAAPLVMGHEFSGQIVECGAGVRTLQPGMRVVVNPSLFCGECENCRNGRSNLCDKKTVPGTSVGGVNTPGAMAEYICVRASSVIGIPDDVSYEDAALLEPFAVSLHGVKRGGDLRGKKTAVIGCGPIGLFALQCIRSAEAAQSIAMDIVPGRLLTARACGATDTLDLLNEPLERVWTLTHGSGADVVFDCVGNERSLRQASEIVRNGGLIVVIGMAAQEIHFPIKRFVAHEFTLTGSYQYLDEIREGILLLHSRKIDFSEIITSVIPLSEGKSAFDALTSKNPKDVKIVLRP
ncbi:MAG: alcohol dehydrogenase catalytic domain-containing protein [Oscillospiraceae bacterium]|nr:alcohol dehydrogenase catalytic domain-containing protein [Oscillospiraceae bacterium]